MSDDDRTLSLNDQQFAIMEGRHLADMFLRTTRGVTRAKALSLAEAFRLCDQQRADAKWDASELRAQLATVTAERDEARKLKVPPSVDELLQAKMGEATARAELSASQQETERLRAASSEEFMFAQRLLRVVEAAVVWRESDDASEAKYHSHMLRQIDEYIAWHKTQRLVKEGCVEP